MCGPSSQEKSLQTSSQGFSQLLQQNYGQLFGQQQGVLTAINRSLNPILAAGPNQRGFDSATRSSLETQAINNAGAANKAAQQAARTYGAGQGGGGTSGLTSGITKQVEAAIGSSSANALATQQNQIAQADFNQGNANYWRAAGGMQALAGEYSPNSAQGGAISENQASFGQASTIEQQEQQKAQMIAGGITGLASMAAGGVAGGINALPGQSFASGFFGGLS